jgi:hypothetical protein
MMRASTVRVQMGQWTAPVPSMADVTFTSFIGILLSMDRS